MKKEEKDRFYEKYPILIVWRWEVAGEALVEPCYCWEEALQVKEELESEGETVFIYWR